MSGVNLLIRELEDSIRRGSPDRRTETLRRVTDLFLRDAPTYDRDQIDLFDVVFARLAAAIEARARADLAERLADISTAPPSVVRSLAHDEIMVARPILERSTRLTDDDLVSVALSKGRDHMLAMAERPKLSETVTDVLLTKGDDVVVHAVAGNNGARISAKNVDRLVERSRADEALQALMSKRLDIPDQHMQQLVDMAKEAARKRLMETLPAMAAGEIAKAVETSATAVEAKIGPTGARNYADALAFIAQRAESAAITETDVAGFAKAGEFEKTVCAITYLTHVSIPSIERLFIDTETDLLLILSKSQNWSFETLLTLLKLRGTPPIDEAARDQVRGAYKQLSEQTAQRVMRFLHVREATHGRTGEAVAGAAALQPRRNAK